MGGGVELENGRNCHYGRNWGIGMSLHNDTCGCAECGNYGQRYNPRAIHNQSCGCSECGNYDNLPTRHLKSEAAQPVPNGAAAAVPSSAEGTRKKRKKALGSR